jgi:hypothetical protein
MSTEEIAAQPPSLSAMVERIGSMFARAYAPDAPKPSSDEIETVLMEGYACALEMERERAQIERRTSVLLAAMGNNNHTGGELRLLSARHTELDRNIRWLRSLLVELGEYGASLRSSE